MAPVVVQEAPQHAIEGAGGYTVRPFVGSDYAALVRACRSGGETLLSAGQARPLEVGKAYATFGQGFTALRDGRITACAGILRKWEGLGEAWLTIASPESRRDGLDVFWLMRQRFRPLVAAMRMRRVEADVRRGWGPGERLVALLGFRLESEMPCYGPTGETFGRWVILPTRVDMFHVER